MNMILHNWISWQHTVCKKPESMGPVCLRNGKGAPELDF